MNKKVHIISGGTISHITSHLALAAPAYATISSVLYANCMKYFKNVDIISFIEANFDLSAKTGGYVG